MPIMQERSSASMLGNHPRDALLSRRCVLSSSLLRSKLTNRNPQFTLLAVYKLVKSSTFDLWLESLKDMRAQARIVTRLDRLAAGNPGDVKPVGSGVSELRIHYGPGYRVYFHQHDQVVVVLLCGGDKRTQAADIKRAIEIAKEWQE